MPLSGKCIQVNAWLVTGWEPLTKSISMCKLGKKSPWTWLFWVAFYDSVSLHAVSVCDLREDWNESGLVGQADRQQPDLFGLLNHPRQKAAGQPRAQELPTPPHLQSVCPWESALGWAIAIRHDGPRCVCGSVSQCATDYKKRSEICWD